MPMVVIAVQVRAYNNGLCWCECDCLAYHFLTLQPLFHSSSDDGDLPVHLLVRSGSANPVTVDLLLRPIIHNPTICAYPGSVGVNLPLHSKFNVLKF